ncbi:MAG: PorT family protein [Bacteroidetes bacterium]|nr:PorT family protein [Bacteroidota bacterium]
MKKLFFIFLMIFAVSQSRAQMTGGLKGGMNINDLIITNKHGRFTEEEFKTRLSFHAGSYVQNTFSDHFGWRIEMLFSNKGVQIDHDGVTTEVSLNYLNWPVLLVYTTSHHLDLEAGLELGYMISGEEQYQSFDMGMDIGARYHFSDKLNIGLRYNLGFPFDFQLDDPELSANPPAYQNSVLQFSLGFNLIQEPALTD